jgi:hypothetical protein
MVVPWISAVRPVARLAFEIHATPALSQGQQAFVGGKLRQHCLLMSKIRMMNKIKWRLLLPGASEPRLTELNPSGL